GAGEGGEGRGRAARQPDAPARRGVRQREGLVRTEVAADGIEGDLGRAETGRVAGGHGFYGAELAVDESLDRRRGKRADQERAVEAPSDERPERRPDARTGRRVRVHEQVERPHAADRIQAADDRTEGRPRDVVDRDVVRLEIPEKGDGRESPRAPATERQAAGSRL